MSKAERLKVEIAFHEKMFFAALAVVIGLAGWSASNFETTTFFILGLAIAGMIFSSSFGIYQYREIKKLIRELEDA